MSKEVSEENIIECLKSQIQSLKNRVKELEDENEKLSSQLSKCCCVKTEEMLNSSDVECLNLVDDCQRESVFGEKTKKTTMNRIPGCNFEIMTHRSKRFVALKLMYFGQRFYGFASEGQMDPTVESEIFKALEKTRLLVGGKKESLYSRCGRTDKGVSSVGQVIALLLRSNLKETVTKNNISGELIPETRTEGEIDYVRVLNRVLPNDIRILGWSPVSIDFSARFSCLAREYKYFFWKGNLDLHAMENAGKKLVGEHDFRNFCKMDVVNFICIHLFGGKHPGHIILECHGSEHEFHNLKAMNFVQLNLKVGAFLWHQVRCMVAVLFMVGQGRESVDVIHALLDMEKTPRKPQYLMAPEIPLVLQSCEFEDVKFICSSGSRKALHIHLENECRTYQLQSAIFHEAVLSCLPLENDQDKATVKKVASHVPLLSRPTEPSYEERRAKLNSRR